MKENIKKFIKIIHQISEGILFLFLILAVLDGIPDLISYKKDPFMYYLIGFSLLIYICLWQNDSFLGKWIHRNDVKDKGI